MTERDHLAELGTAVAAYLSAMQAAGECVANACPGVGEPFGQRILRLRGRLAFDPTSESIRESVGVLTSELQDFALMASAHNQRLAVEVRRGIAAVERDVEILERRTRSFTALAAHLDSTQPDAANGRDGLHIQVESFAREIDSLLQGLRAEARGVENRLTEGGLTDPVTGLMNRDEVRRRIEALRTKDVMHTVVTLEVRNQAGGSVSGAVLRQAATKLAMQFRHQDLLARWSETEFLVVFQGAPELALARIRQAVDQVCGRYHSPGGPSVDLSVNILMEQPEAAAV